MPRTPENRWSWPIGRLAGIQVFVHATFPLFLIWLAANEWVTARNAKAVFSGVSFVLLIFVCVVLHELGHALTARRYGIRTLDITLLPIGGVARLERMPDDPRQELVVALAGPAVNVVIALVLFAATGFQSPLPAQPPTDGTAAALPVSFLERLILVNAGLVIFNMLPAFPMDGGRVLRALLAIKMNYVRATQLAATLGQGIAILLGLLGLFTNPMLVFIAVFVWIGAGQEAASVALKRAIRGLGVTDAMITDFKTLNTTDSLQRAVELMLAGAQHDFPVMDGDRLAGVLTRAGLIRALTDGSGSTAGEAMQSTIHTLPVSESLETAMAQLQTETIVPVVQQGRVVGLLTPENLAELLMVREAALRRS